MATYYVRAKVYDVDGVLIDTVNLTDKGGQRFSRRWRVPVDRSGQGAYISIITSVYTDAGYTTKSDNYGDEENTYLVFDRVLGARGGGSGGGNLDIGTIRRVMAEELEKAKPEEVEKEEKPEVEEVDNISPQFKTLASKIDSLAKEMATIPRDNSIDMSDIKQAMETIYSSVLDKDVTPVTDLTPIIDTIDQATRDILQQVEGVRRFVAGTEKTLTDMVVKTVEDNMKSAKFVNEFKIEPNTATKPVPQPEQRAYDIKKLAS